MSFSALEILCFQASKCLFQISCLQASIFFWGGGVLSFASESMIFSGFQAFKFSLHIHDWVVIFRPFFSFSKSPQFSKSFMTCKNSQRTPDSSAATTVHLCPLSDMGLGKSEKGGK